MPIGTPSEIDKKLAEMRDELERWLIEQNMLRLNERIIVNFEIEEINTVQISLYRKAPERLFKSMMTNELTEADWRELSRYHFSERVKTFLEKLHKTNNTAIHVDGRLYQLVNAQLRIRGLPFRLMATDSGQHLNWKHRTCCIYKKA